MSFITGSFTILDSVDSTNNYAMAKAHAGMAKNGDSYFAVEQTAGKGQRGRQWQSGKDLNIALSIVIEPQQVKLLHQFHLSALVALAGRDFFSRYAGDETTIKWPNDIYWRDRKAGGVLIENVLRGNAWKWSIVGIGININQSVFDSSLQNPVSLKQITGKEFEIIELARELHQFVLGRINAYSVENYDQILNEYNSHLFRLNEKVKLKRENMVFETQIKGVSAFGQLLTTDVMNNQFDFGEVEWVL
ncbi:biotin--[acetyl-CoA-carboxylase] ligase [Ferruginibacter lapsinanis]|uniref:biotin--[acetyl-CoA-carboxylase] ligase n=1 Tax=Ferruginibacter lapsinanis TaxID=563172 RepID=UPI001E435F30|nr:biotin--[acetyl-CoA-carboxylase] ligase [Ferruginibacter lapsinanis]UEG50976.1 biotin--[acetyl-CoA-carboxylase] ligase [Ferruginibacter lapsinanis]